MLRVTTFADYIVTCVTKGESWKFSDCRCITRIGAWEHQGTYVISLSREEAHDKVKSGSLKLWVQAGEKYTPVQAAEREGTKYIRSEANDTTTDNLLNHPAC